MGGRGKRREELGGQRWAHQTTCSYQVRRGKGRARCCQPLGLWRRKWRCSRGAEHPAPLWAVDDWMAEDHEWADVVISAELCAYLTSCWDITQRLFNYRCFSSSERWKAVDGPQCCSSMLSESCTTAKIHTASVTTFLPSHQHLLETASQSVWVLVSTPLSSARIHLAWDSCARCLYKQSLTQKNQFLQWSLTTYTNHT